MEKEDAKRFKDYMEAVGLVCNKEITPATLRVFWRVLAHHPAEEVFAGFDRVLQSKIYGFPSPGDIVTPPSEELDAAAILAWDKLTGAVGRVGGYRSVKFDDPVLMLTVKHQGGWPQFCGMDESELKYYRPQWLKTYKALLQKKQQGEVLPAPDHLVGIEEKENSAHYPDAVKPPVEIGAPTREGIGFNPAIEEKK